MFLNAPKARRRPPAGSQSRQGGGLVHAQPVLDAPACATGRAIQTPVRTLSYEVIPGGWRTDLSSATYRSALGPPGHTDELLAADGVPGEREQAMGGRSPKDRGASISSRRFIGRPEATTHDLQQPLKIEPRRSSVVIMRGTDSSSGPAQRLRPAGGRPRVLSRMWDNQDVAPASGRDGEPMTRQELGVSEGRRPSRACSQSHAQRLEALPLGTSGLRGKSVDGV